MSEYLKDNIISVTQKIVETTQKFRYIYKAIVKEVLDDGVLALCVKELENEEDKPDSWTLASPMLLSKDWKIPEVDDYVYMTYMEGNNFNARYIGFDPDHYLYPTNQEFTYCLYIDDNTAIFLDNDEESNKKIVIKNGENTFEMSTEKTIIDSDVDFEKEVVFKKKVTFKDEVTFETNVKISGLLDVDGKIINTHIHGGVLPGGSNTSPMV